MANILCVYYSRTGRTARLVRSIAQELDCEIVKLEDGVNRKGLSGWLVSGLHAVARKVPPIKELTTEKNLKEYDLVILATPVWAGRCSAPMRSFLMQHGDELRKTAYIITRSCSLHYDEVFEQMDQYLRKPRVHAASIEADSIGSDFWKDEFLTALRNTDSKADSKEGEHAG